MHHHDFFLVDRAVGQVFCRINVTVVEEPRDPVAVSAFECLPGADHGLVLAIQYFLVGASDKLISLVNFELPRAIEEGEVVSLFHSALFVVSGGPNVGAARLEPLCGRQVHRTKEDQSLRNVGNHHIF